MKKDTNISTFKDQENANFKKANQERPPKKSCKEVNYIDQENNSRTKCINEEDGNMVNRLVITKPHFFHFLEP